LIRPPPTEAKAAVENIRSGRAFVDFEMQDDLVDRSFEASRIDAS